MMEAWADYLDELRDDRLGVALRTCDADMSYRERVRFLARTLDAACITHDDPEAHADRLIPKGG